MALNSCLARPINRTIATDKISGAFNFIFFSPGQGALVRTLGVICESPGGRVIFFPGMRVKQLLWISEEHRIVKGPFGNVDHVTLEKDMGSWHFTFIESTAIPAYRLFNLSQTRKLWFSLAVKNVSFLEETPQLFRLTMPVPYSNNEIDRRVQESLEEFKRGQQYMLQLSSLDHLSDLDVVVFDFVLIDRSDSNPYAEGLIDLRPPATKKVPIYPNPLPLRIQKVRLPSSMRDLLISTYKFEATLEGEAIYSTRKQR